MLGRCGGSAYRGAMQDCLALPSRRRPDQPDRIRILLCVGLFWLFSYALLSWRTGLLVGDAFQLVTPRRAIAITAGAGLFWLGLARIMARGRDVHPLAVIAGILPAGIVVLGVRLGLDRLAFANAPLPLDRNIHWVLLWTGYFGLCLIAALAWRLHRSARAARSVAALPAAAARVTPLPAESWEWLTDAIAAEIAELRPAERRALIARLTERAGYALADEGDPDFARRNARAALVRRLAARLSR